MNISMYHGYGITYQVENLGVITAKKQWLLIEKPVGVGNVRIELSPNEARSMIEALERYLLEVEPCNS